LDGTNIFHIDIADENGTTVASMSRALITNSGDYKMNIVLSGIKLSTNETYTLKITPGVGFDDNAVRLLTAVSNSSETGDSSYNGMVQDDHASLIMVFRYEYFALSYYLLCWALAFLACAILVFHINLGPKLTMAFNILMALAMPVTAFAIVEWLNFGNILNLWVMHGFLNLVWYFMVYAIIFAMFNSLRISLVFGTIIFFVCGLINHFTILFRGTTVLPSDILAAGTALKVFEKYQFNLSLVIVCSFFILLCLVQLAARTNFRLPGLKPRLIMCGSVALVTITFVSIFMNTAFLDSVGLTPYQWKQTKACRDRGFIANFTSNIPSLIVKKPVGYNANKLTNILDDEDKLLQDTKAPDEFLNVNAAPDGKKPNIIAIMNESLADFNFQGDLKTDKDPLRFIHSLDENVIKGKLAMPVFGAGTSNSEFEFLTGNSVSFLPFGCVPYQQFVEQDAESLVSTMMGQGYSSVALHPYNPDGWARTTVYKDFEFEEFISEGAFVNAEKLRWYISDQSNFEMLETLYERRDTSKPFFAFNVTMQNHGGYDFSPFTPTVALQGYNNDYPDVEQYLSMAKASDAAFEK
ncbi:MAG: sulfatase-like hydrolase/transferase, partial [Oscillospiraceae bacterium]